MRRPRQALAPFLVGALLSVCASASAETFTVTRTDDPTTGTCEPGDCSLRQALHASNTSTTVDDMIVVPASSSHYAVDSADLEALDQAIVRGAGADRTIIDPGGTSLALTIGSEGVVLEGLTITGALGAIQNNGGLTLRGVAIEHNERFGGTAGIQNNGPLTVESSFIGFNTSTGSVAGSAIQSNDPLTVFDSTIASNRSQGPAIQANVEAKITSSAIVSNTREGGTDAVAFYGSGPVLLADSIVAGNSNPGGVLNCSTEATTLTTLGGNVEDSNTCGLGARDRTAVDPGLGPLGLHGGTTSLYELLPTSPAVDFAVSCPATDQRGSPRPRGAACDSGPFELEPAPPPPPSPAGDKTVSVLIGGGKVQVDGHGVARVSLTCPASEQSSPCSGTLRLKTRKAVDFHAKIGPVSLPKARFKVAAGKTKKVAVHLGSEKANLIQDEPKARRVQATANVADAAGNHGVVKRNLRLAPAKKR
jgi:hypothetical protein